MREEAQASTFILSEIGSRAYGLDTAESDHDLMGVCLESPSTVFGPQTFESYRWRSQPEGARSTKDDTDIVVYSLRKFAALALAGNPTILSLLFTPEADSTLGRELQALAPAFHSRRAAAKFIGYLTSQRDKMTGKRTQKTNRPELIAKYGHDVKFAAAAVRLGVTGVQFLSTGRIELPMSDPWNGAIRAIRLGELPQGYTLRRLDELTEQLKALGDDPGIPAEPDVEGVTSFVHHAHQRYWRIELGDFAPAARLKEITRDR